MLFAAPNINIFLYKNNDTFKNKLINWLYGDLKPQESCVSTFYLQFYPSNDPLKPNLYGTIHQIKYKYMFNWKRHLTKPRTLYVKKKFVVNIQRINHISYDNRLWNSPIKNSLTHIDFLRFDYFSYAKNKKRLFRPTRKKFINKSQTHTAKKKHNYIKILFRYVDPWGLAKLFLVPIPQFNLVVVIEET